MFQRREYEKLSERIQEPRQFIQVLADPRQVGKTTLVRQLLKGESVISHYASADEATLRDRVWIEQQWEQARLLTRGVEEPAYVMLVNE